MASVSYNQQAFSIDGRKVWILGASLQYSRIPPALWAQRIAAAKQAGFNTIETACPWLIHEPRRGRFHFDDDADLKKFIGLCGEAGMKVIVRVGPYVGSQFDAGGFPSWLVEMPGVVLREDNETYLEHVSRYFRKLLAEIVPLQVTNGGPVLLVQAEHAWECSNEEQAEDYLAEITRFIRENGVTVPIVNANDLWQETPDTIDTWRGWSELLVHLRQLRSVHPDRPRLVSSFDVSEPGVWGAADDQEPRSPQRVLAHLAEILAAGAQPVVSPFHGGTNFGFLGGRVAGQPAGFVTTTTAPDAPLGEAGARGEHYNAIRRLITFANHFGHVFAEVDAEDSPVVLDTGAIGLDGKANGGKSHGGGSALHRGAAVVPLRGAQGRVVFVFADETSRNTTLLLEDGVRMPVSLGDMPVGWFVLDVDLHGAGRLDYANLMPWAIVNRSIIVFHGPEKAAGFLSIDGTPLEFTVPGGGPRERDKPMVMEHGNLTVVICNHAQIDTAYHDDHHVYVGVAGLSMDGQPLPAGGMKAWRISSGGKIDEISAAGRGAAKSAAHDHRSLKPAHWQVLDLSAHSNGVSPRFASLEGPASLMDCGAMQGYGWYRLRMPRAAGRKRLCHIPQAADRAHLYCAGRLLRIIGVGPGAKSGSFDLRLDKDDPVLVALVDNFGRFAEGNQLATPKGLCGHVYAVREIRSPKPKIASARPVNPFVLRGFIAGRTSGQLSDSRQVIWTIAHPRKTPLLIEVNGAARSGTFVLNDQPVAYYAGSTGGLYDAILIDAENKALKRGKNVLRFAPDSRAEDAADEVMRKTTIFECEESLSENAQWAFAKWELPAASAYQSVHDHSMRSYKGAPCWWRGEVEIDAASADHTPWWLDVSGLTKGQAFVNGRNLGRYFTATATGQAVGPQTRLYVPEPWIRAGQLNEIALFDEHGAAPTRVRLLRGIA